MNVKIPEEDIIISSPEIEKLNSSPSESDASTFPIVIWFSETLNLESEVIMGTSSLTLVTRIVMSLVTVVLPSVNESVRAYFCLSS